MLELNKKKFLPLTWLKNKTLVDFIEIFSKKTQKMFAEVKNVCIFATAIKRWFGSSVG